MTTIGDPVVPSKDRLDWGSHLRAMAGRCTECRQPAMVIQIRCHGCNMCASCLESLAEIVRRDSGQ